jgi:hypothetical protein
LDKVGGDGFFLLVEDDFAEEDAAAAEEDFDDDETAVEEDFDEDAVAAEDDFDDDAATAEDLDFDEEDATGGAALAEPEVVVEDNPSDGGIMIAFAMTWYSMEASLRMPRNMLDRLERRAVVVSDASLTSTTSLMAMLDVESFFASPSSSFSSHFLL